MHANPHVHTHVFLLTFGPEFRPKMVVVITSGFKFGDVSSQLSNCPSPLIPPPNLPVGCFALSGFKHGQIDVSNGRLRLSVASATSHFRNKNHA
jgi:hypothetical protein